MNCRQCETRNPIGNKFCRECGAKLTLPEGTPAAEEAARAERERKGERAAALLAQAFQLKEERQWADALPLAEEAAELLPDSTSALALLTALYERLGMTEKAVAAMERVVELNPESAADLATLERLRRGDPPPPLADLPPAERRRAAAMPLPWVPFAAAGGVMAVVLGIGLSLVSRANQPRPAAPSAASSYPLQPNLPTVVSPAPGGVMPPLATAGMPKPDLPPPPDVRDDPFVRQSPRNARPEVGAPTRPTPTAPRRTARRATGGSGGGGMTPMLPLPSDIKNKPTAADAGAGTVAPVIVSPPQPINPGGAVTGGTFGGGGRLSVGPPPAANGGGTTRVLSGNETETQTENGGYIRIKIGDPQTPPPAANPPGGDEPPGETSLNRARRLQGAGRYGEAVRAYQDALNGGMTGAETAEAYQAIAQCHDRLGNPTAARSEYGNAIRAYEAQISAGRNIGGARQGIVTCRAALEALGGLPSNL